MKYSTKLFVVVSSLICWLTTTGQTQNVVSVGAEGCIFVDDDIIAHKENVHRTLHPANKLPMPVVEPEKIHRWVLFPTMRLLLLLIG